MNPGYIYALLAFGVWGIIPIYWVLFNKIDPIEVLCHRVLWSFVFYTLIVSIKKLKTHTTVNQKLFLGFAGLLIGINWGVYIWAVNNGHVAESSLGYFINPLINFILGVLLFHEHISQPKKVAIGFAMIGVFYLTWVYQGLPWIALSLAFTFGIYGAIKKRIQIPSILGMQLETLILLPFVLGYLIHIGIQNPHIYLERDFSVWLLLISCGVVTGLPLIWFSSAAKRIPISTLGFFQYLAPTLQFLCAILYFKEDFSVEKAIGFSLVWLGLGIVISEAVLKRKP